MKRTITSMGRFSKKWGTRPAIVFFALLIAGVVGPKLAFTQQQVIDYTTNGTFTVPFGVSQIKVECWGAGGAGGARTTNGRSGGGGGGAYASSTISVVLGDTYAVVVGAGGTSSTTNNGQVDGGSSSFGGAMVVAAGGISLNRNGTAGAAGGQASASTGEVKYSGGNGGTSTGTSAGGGGGVAGAVGNGGNANNGTGGTGYGPVEDGKGKGADGPDRNADGNTGNNYGGGGSGASRNRNNRNGGAGAGGFVRVTYTTAYTTFFYTTGNPASLTSWKNRVNQSPANFTTSYQAFVIPAGVTATLQLPLAIIGDSSVLYIADGAKLVLGNYNLTVGNMSRIENNVSGMIDITGTGQVIKMGAKNTDFCGLFPIGNNGTYAPVQINSLSVTSIAANAYISVKTVASAASGIIGTYPLNRYWETKTSGFSGSVLADISFSYSNSDIPAGSVGSYDLLASSDAGVTWTYPGGVSPSGVNPFRAKSTTTLDAIWSASIPDRRIWYSHIAGDWDNPEVWTLDPSGSQYNNPNGLTPTTSQTAMFDDIIVLSGRKITVSQPNKKNHSLTVYGTVDFGTTTGHEFNLINGSGYIGLAADNFPSGDATDFITAGKGEGTVEYYGVSRNISTPRTFFNMVVNLAVGNKLTLLADYTLNGNLTIESGDFCINSTATTPLNMTIYGDVNVESSGKISTGTGNARHQLNLYGDFTNRGIVNFSNRIEPNYSNEATNGIVDVNFINSAANQSILCRNVTNFYRIAINKGADDTYILNIDALSSTYFNLFGFANENHQETTSQLAVNNNALGLIAGTVRIGSAVNIPTLSLANTYIISEKAKLLVDGGTVFKNAGSSIAVYGSLSTNSGTLQAKVNNGIVLCGNGVLNVAGGVVAANQIRISDAAGTHNGSYVQTGGTVDVIGDNINTDFFVFTLTNPTSVFNMSGGTLKVNTSTSNRGIFINSSVNNTRVTGGSVIAETKSTNDFIINSTAPFWNLTLKNASASARAFRVEAATNIGAANVTVAAQPLQVLNDLRLFGQESGGASYPVVELRPGTNDVYIGGSFYIENGSKYTAISGGTAPYDSEANQPTTRNTTYFNKTDGTGGVEVLYVGNTVDALELGNLVVDRTSGYQLTTTSKTGVSGRTNESIVVDVNGTTSVLSGILSQGLYSIRTWGAIVNYGRMGTWLAGTTPERAQIKLMENSNLTFTTNSDAIFGNIHVDINPPAKLTLTSDTYIERLEYIKGLIYIKNYILKVDDMWNMNPNLFTNYQSSSDLAVSNTGYSGSSMIYTDGKAGDGGLSIKISQNSLTENETNRLNNFGPITYPLGFTTDGGNTLFFRPAQVVVKNFADDGYITIRTVSGYLQTTNNSGNTLQHYWRVTHNGFTAKPTVALRFYYQNRNHTATNIVDLFNTNATQEQSFVSGKVLDESPYTRSYESASDIIRTSDTRKIVINGTSINGLFTPAANGITLENANYTAGVQNRFTGSVYIYYSIDNERAVNGSNLAVPWQLAESWTRSDILDSRYSPHDSRQPRCNTIAGNPTPGAGDVVAIGWIPWDDEGRGNNLRGMPHMVWVCQPQEVAEVVFTKMTDADGNPVARVYRTNFQFRPTLVINGVDNYDNVNGDDNGSLRAKLVKGEGLFWNRQTDPDYTIMDIGDFARQDSSYVIYENFTNNRVISKSADLFPNIYISNDSWGANDKNFTFSRNIVTTGNVELLGDVNLVLPTAATGDITIGRNLVMFTSQNSGGGAEIRYPNSGTARNITVKGDLVMENEASIISVFNPNAGIIDHQLHVEGNIVLGMQGRRSNGLQLWTANNVDRITLYLDGDQNMTYTAPNSEVSNLYRIVVNKGTSAATTASFDADYILSGPTSGVGTPKALELMNGTFIQNNPNTNRNLVLSSGNDYFDIPSTAGLTLKRGGMVVSGNSGIMLDGILTVDDGTLEMGTTQNHIEYTASGNSTLIINGGTVNVGGQIHRSVNTSEGILKYNQSAGEVAVGLVEASINDRGVFEVLNNNSSFTMTGGTLSIARAQNNPAIASFYFDPDLLSVSTSAKINIGHASTPPSQIIGFYASKNLPSLRVFNGSNNNPTAKLEVVPATITSLLTIDAGSTFDANGLDLTLNGNFSCLGNFVPNGNTTFFSGSSTQTVTGNSNTINFYNLDKTNNNTLNLSGTTAPLLVQNDLFIRGGILAANGNNIKVKGNILNSGTHTCNNNIEFGIHLMGDISQSISGEGIYGKLSVQNLAGIIVPTDAINNITITGALKLMAGVLNIGQNYLNLGVNATIEETSPFSISNMITTNISFNDNGVRKFFKSGSTNNFIYPVGSGNKYTPVTINITANANSTGSITVVPANEIHPSIIEDVETGAAIVDSDNALKYYWTLKSEGITGFSGTAVMNFNESDIAVTTPYTSADYITTRLLRDGSGNWDKYEKTDFDETNHQMNFTYTGVNDQSISGDYTAGAVDDSKNGAIPDMVAEYETNRTGDWSTGSIWTPNVDGGPRGAIARINNGHIVNVLSDGISGYKTQIFGRLNLYQTSGHRLGIAEGTGTIYSEIGTIPAAVYDKFFSSAGGTLEFGGTDEYEFLGNILMVNNLVVSGSGKRLFPNNNLLLNGDFTINGDPNMVVSNDYNKQLSIKGDMIRTSGIFDAGSGSAATVELLGTLEQNILGTFTAENAFNNLKINNANNVVVESNIEIEQKLYLTNGIFDVADGVQFKLDYPGTVWPTGGSISSFISGEFTKEMINGNSFVFPIGDKLSGNNLGRIALNSVQGPSGINNWTTRYYYRSTPNNDQFEAPISFVSHVEYWTITAPTGGSSIISITLDGSSDVANTIEDLSNIRIVGYNNSTLKWEIIGGGATVTGNSTNGTVTTTTQVNYGSYSYYTIGSITPLDASSASFTSAANVSLCNGESTELVVAFSGTAPWILTYNNGSTNITTAPIATSPYRFTVSPEVGTSVYSLVSITANGVAGSLTGITSVRIVVNAIPNVSISTDSPGIICEGSGFTQFTATSGLSNYQFSVNGETVQNSSSYTLSTLLQNGVNSIDVQGTSANGCAATSSALTITVNPLPDDATSIVGEVSVCNSTTHTYSVANIANATEYVWSVTGGGAAIQSGQNTNTASIKFTTSGVKTIKVYGKNSCGNGVESTVEVAVNTASTAGDATTITGDSQVCKGASGSYSVPVVDNATSYIWQYSGTGATINGTGNSVTVDFADNATSGNLTVKGTNGCNTGGSSTAFPINVNATPNVTFVDATLQGCGGTDMQIQSTVNGGTSPYTYTWSGTGTEFLSDGTSSTPVFSANPATETDYYLTLLAVDSKGCIGEGDIEIKVFEAPIANAGPDAIDICTGIEPIALSGASATGSYTGIPTWSVADASGTFTQSINPALAIFTPNSIYGETTLTLTITGSNGCSTVSDTRLIKWSSVPNQPAEFSEAYESVCKGSTYTYTVPNDAFVTTYTWSYSGTNATIVGSGNSVSIEFANNATSGKLSVYGSSSCGNSVPRSIDIIVNDIPTVPQITAIDACAGAVVELTVVDAIGLNIVWSVSSPYSISGNILTVPNNDILFPVDIPDLIFYPDVKVEVTNAAGCKNEVTNNSTNKYIVIHRIPRTGPQYHIPNANL